VAQQPEGLRERKKIATRLAIARAAMALFEERGYDGTTVDDIAAAANVSRRTFFRYFAGKDEVFIVDPEGKLQALHAALAEGPPEEPTIDALRRGILALTAAYFEPELLLAETRVVYKEPALAAAGLAYQVRWEDALAQEVADDLEVDIDRDPRPRIVAHAAVAILRAGVASWLGDGGHGTPADAVAHTFDLTTPALEAVLAMPVNQPAARVRRRAHEPAARS
jgi:AcrR family transcriptional regulator